MKPLIHILPYFYNLKKWPKVFSLAIKFTQLIKCLVKGVTAGDVPNLPK